MAGGHVGRNVDVRRLRVPLQKYRQAVRRSFRWPHCRVVAQLAGLSSPLRARDVSPPQADCGGHNRAWVLEALHDLSSRRGGGRELPAQVSPALSVPRSRILPATATRAQVYLLLPMTNSSVGLRCAGTGAEAGRALP